MTFLYLFLTYFILNILYSNFISRVRNIKVKKDSINGKVRILQITDLHNCYRAKKIMTKEKVDFIVITGDIIDKKTSNRGFVRLEKFLIYLKNFNNNIFFVVGNHDVENLDNYSRLSNLLNKLEIKLLLNESVYLTDEIILHGINYYEQGDNNITNVIRSLVVPGKFNILASHRPLYLEIECGLLSGIDLVLSGHYHGGVARIPLLGAVKILEEEKFFKNVKFSSGLHELLDTKLYVCSGAGKGEWYYIRFSNPLQISVIQIN